MRSVVDDFIVAEVAAALDCDPILVEIQRGVVDEGGKLYPAVQVVVRSWAAMVDPDVQTTVAQAVNRALLKARCQ